jgi:hypothetical protein
MKINISFTFGKKEAACVVEQLRDLLVAAYGGASNRAEPSRATPGPTTAPPDPPPAPPPPTTPPPEEERYAASPGSVALRTFLEAWRKGLNAYNAFLPEEGVEQPDRADLLKRFHNHPDVYDVLQYILKCGSLQKAIFDCLPDLTEDQAIALANTVVSPASIVFPDLITAYDWRQNPFKDKK